MIIEHSYNIHKPRHHHAALQIFDALLTPQSDPAGDVGIIQELEVLTSGGKVELFTYTGMGQN